MSNYNKNANVIRNVIPKVIPLYPKYRLLCDCSRGELLLNGILHSLMESPSRNIPYYREYLAIVSDFVHDLKEAGISGDRWEIYSAAIISHIAADMYSDIPSGLEEYTTHDLRNPIHCNEVSESVFRLAESLIKLRDLAEKKRNENPDREKTYYSVKQAEERTFYEVIENVDDSMKQNRPCREYIVLMERVFGSTNATWEDRHETGVAGFREMISRLPQQCIWRKGELYKIKSIENFCRPTRQIDDIELGEMDTGIVIRMVGVNHSSQFMIHVHDYDDNKTWGEILAENFLHIPDRRTWEFVADLQKGECV